MQKTHEEMVEFLNSPDSWPYWPVLPMKNPQRFYKPVEEHLGFVTADFPHIVLKEKPTTPMGIILQLRFECSEEQLDEMGFFNPKKLIAEDVRPQYESMVAKRYQDVHAMLDDGWVID